MVNQDQNDFNMQQDFDEFDNMVDEELDMLDMDYADDSTNRKKRQTIFYIVLVFMIAIGGGAAWFLFFRPADTVTPLPMPGNLPPAAESPALPPMADGLPVGVSSADTQQPSMDQTDMPPLAAPDQSGLPPMATDTATNDMLPPMMPAAENAAPVDGTLAEALPPPSAPSEAVTAPVTPPVASDNNMAQDFAPIDDSLNTASPLIPAPNGTHDGLAAQPVDAIASANTATDTIVTAPAPAQDVIPMAPVNTVESSAASNETVQNLQQRLQEMEGQIQSLTQELQTVRNTPVAAAPTTTGAVSDNQVTELNQKLDRLAQQVDALDQRTTTFATELQKRADAPVTAPAIKKPAPKKAPVKAKATTPAKAKPAATRAVSGNWELRSAQPGIAWLGKHGSSEMGRYAVGENVPGLGTVQDVSIEGGRWIVKTTGGTLRQ